MGTKRNIVLVLGTIVLLVGMNFATMPIGANGIEVLPPAVTKGVSQEDISFGSIETQTTVTIEVTGDGGTSSTITPMDVVFSIDSSGSMVTNDPSDLRLAAAKYFVDQMDNTRDQAGVNSWDIDVDFSKGLWTDFDDTDGIKYWIDQVDSAGWTNPDEGLADAVQMLDDDGQSDSIKVIIFLTDGQPAGPPGDPGVYTYAGDGGPVDDAVDAGYIIFSIGLSIAVNSTAEVICKDMADATGGAYYSSASASNLQDIYDGIYEEIVTSTIPHYVDVIEVLEEYIVLDEDSFNIDPDSITYNGDGTTTIVWLNIGQYTTDGDAALTADETVTLTFDVGADKPGYHMEVQVEGEAIVEYSDSDGVYVDYVDIPQAYINVAQSVDLIADGGDEYIDVGDVIIWQDATNIYVKYVTDDGWEMTETHLHVAESAADIPQTKKLNPKIGKFDHSEDHVPAVTEYTYTIPWTVDPGDILYIAAHAVVQKEIVSLIECDPPEPPVYRIETAWGEGTGFGGSSWAMYIVYEDP